MSLQEKRKFSRIHFDAPVTISHEQQQWQAKLVDISLKGMLTERPANWPQAAIDYHVTVQLPGHEINMEVETAHSEADAIGFRCVSIDLDSIANLKRMVELNLGDEVLLEREITTMIEA